MSKAEIFEIPESQEYYFDEGCYILEMLNSPSDPAVSIARARVSPGNTTRFHSLKGVTERYVIQKGQGVVTLGCESAGGVIEQELGVGAVVVIPPGVKQRIYNSGVEDLEFLAVCSPRFTLECYVDMESN